MTRGQGEWPCGPARSGGSVAPQAPPASARRSARDRQPSRRARVGRDVRLDVLVRRARERRHGSRCQGDADRRLPPVRGVGSRRRLGRRRRPGHGPERRGRVDPGRLQRLRRERRQALLRGDEARGDPAVLRGRVRGARGRAQARGRPRDGLPLELVARLGRRPAGQRAGSPPWEPRHVDADGDGGELERGQGVLQPLRVPLRPRHGRAECGRRVARALPGLHVRGPGLPGRQPHAGELPRHRDDGAGRPTSSRGCRSASREAPAS